MGFSEPALSSIPVLGSHSGRNCQFAMGPDSIIFVVSRLHDLKEPVSHFECLRKI